MYVKYGTITLELTENEIFTMAYSLLHEYCSDVIIESHWKNHGVSSWLENTKHYRGLANNLFRIIGRSDIPESVEKEAEIKIAKLYSLQQERLNKSNVS